MKESTEVIFTLEEGRALLADTRDELAACYIAADEGDHEKKDKESPAVKGKDGENP